MVRKNNKRFIELWGAPASGTKSQKRFEHVAWLRVIMMIVMP
jgi:hypothetical protein